MGTGIEKNKPKSKIIGYALLIIGWVAGEYFAFKRMDGGALSSFNIIILPVQFIVLFGFYFYWLYKKPVRRSSLELLNTIVQEIRTVENSLISQGIKEDYSKLGNGELIELYKSLESEIIESKKAGAKDRIKDIENTCKLCFMGDLLDSRNIERWTYNKDNRSKEELLKELSNSIKNLNNRGV